MKPSRTPCSRALVAPLALLALLACDDEQAKAPTLSRAELLDPETCKTCHPTHYRQWQSSMHAYAAEDPVFRAMNQRGQEETGGALGDFCVQCHAPMAVREGLTSDGLNLDELPKSMLGVTCYFCHNAIDVKDKHNAPVALANDTTMRAALRDPVRPDAHGVAYSPLHDRNRAASSALCGSCHDIVTPKGVHLERTFAEYQASIFAMPGPGFETCQGCHMPGKDGVAADQPGVPSRRVHSHLWPGVDVALTEFPDRDLQRAAIEKCELPASIQFFELEATTPFAPEFTVKVTLETAAGHKQPSGAAQDRRMWVELTAYDQNDAILYQSGNIADDESEAPAPGDPDRWLFHDLMRNEAGEHVHMFWEAASIDDTTHESLPAALSLEPGSHSLSREYRIVREPARVRVRVRIRPMSLDVLRDLVASGHLAESIVSAMPTFTVFEASATWDAATLDFDLNEMSQPECDFF